MAARGKRREFPIFRKLRDSQIAFQAECKRMGVPYLVAWDVREVFDFLVEEGAVTTP